LQILLAPPQTGRSGSQKKGDPHFLLIALVLNTYPDHLYLAGPPVFLQKLLFALLAPLSRVRGYRIEIEPAR
jgi:hypothetical protein